MAEFAPFKDKYDGFIGELEQLQEEFQRTIIQLMSPAHTDRTLPTFAKRPRLIGEIKSGEYADGQGGQGNAVLESDAALESFRCKSLSGVLERLREKVTRMRDTLEGAEFITEEEVSSSGALDGAAVAPYIEPFPSLFALEQLLTQNQGNKIIATRLQSAISMFRTIHGNFQAAWQSDTRLLETTANIHHILIETLLRMFQRDVTNVANVMIEFYESRINAHLHQFDQYARHQRQSALSQQQALYQDMYERIKQQHSIFIDMMNVLQAHASQLTTQRERQRAEDRVRHLQKKNRAVFVEAEIYYQQAHAVFVFQPLSPMFYKAIRQWLFEFQQLLAEQLLALQRQHDLKQAAAAAAAASAQSQTATPSKARPDATPKDWLEQSALYKYAQRIDRSRLLEAATSAKPSSVANVLLQPPREAAPGTPQPTVDAPPPGAVSPLPPASSAASSAASSSAPAAPSATATAMTTSTTTLVVPSADLMRDLLLGFTEFHLNNNRQSLDKLQTQITQLDHSWRQLTEQVTRASEVQQKWYAVKEPQLPDIRQHVTVAALGSSEGTAVAAANATSISSPEVIKLLLQLDSEIKVMEERRDKTFAALKHKLTPEFLRTQEQTAELVRIVDFLKQYQQFNRDWEQRIRQEKAFVQTWKDMCRANSRHVAMQFVEWNYFVTGQIDILLASLNLFSANVFFRIRELSQEFIAKLSESQQKRASELELELDLLGKLHEDLRREDFAVADELVRLQAQTAEWIDRGKRHQLLTQQARFKQVLQYHVAALDAFLTHLISNGQLAKFLALLDRMYERATRDEETAPEQVQFVGKAQFLLDKLHLTSPSPPAAVAPPRTLPLSLSPPSSSAPTPPSASSFVPPTIAPSAAPGTLADVSLLPPVLAAGSVLEVDKTPGLPGSIAPARVLAASSSSIGMKATRRPQATDKSSRAPTRARPQNTQ